MAIIVSIQNLYFSIMTKNIVSILYELTIIIKNSLFDICILILKQEISYVTWRYALIIFFE